MKKKVALEEFIRSHRQEFDDLKAPSRVWYHVNPSPPRVNVMWKWTAVAASALLLVLSGYLIGSRSGNPRDIAGWKEYQDKSQYYEAQIEQKLVQLKAMNIGDDVLSDIRLLDHVYQEMRDQILNDPGADTEALFNAMIRHQRQKLEVMEEIINRYDKYTPDENEVREM
jgi:hypothetical protein